MKIKKFICGFCKDKNILFLSSRSGLRQHLIKNHVRANALKATWIQSTDTTRGHYSHPNWWIVEEFK